MSAPIDEQTAWDLVRAVVPGSMGRDVTVRVTVDAADDVWLDVVADGTWKASADMSDAARQVVDIYLPLQLASDLVMGQLGQSLDGRIATEAGHSHYVTGPKDIERLHRLRALVDAVIVGARTVAQDDPRLTVRLVDGASPVRVVLDPSGRLAAGRRVFSEPGARTLLVRGDVEGGPDAARAEAGAGSAMSTSGHAPEILCVPFAPGAGLDLVELLRQLRARGLRRILVEGGGVTVSRFLQAGLLDRLHLTVAPLLIGSGRPAITLAPIRSLDLALRPPCRRFTLGEDVLFDLDLLSRSA